jgi:hypothetical protein
VPVESIGEDATEENPERAAAGGNEAEDAHGSCPLCGVGEERHHQRQGDGGNHRAPGALYRSGRNEHFLRARESAYGRRRCEESDADEEERSMSQEVTQPPAEQ